MQAEAAPHLSRLSIFRRPQQVQAAISEGREAISVISADTDVFVLLCDNYLSQQWSAKVYMRNFSEEANAICIQSTVKKHEAIVPSLLAAHALSGCDTVPRMVGIGKSKAITALKKMPLTYIGRKEASEDDYMLEGKRFVALCYGISNDSSSSNNFKLIYSLIDMNWPLPLPCVFL